jgi:hypothetical protein
MMSARECSRRETNTFKPVSDVGFSDSQKTMRKNSAALFTNLIPLRNEAARIKKLPESHPAVSLVRKNQPSRRKIPSENSVSK